jgi:hypothetical protein
MLKLRRIQTVFFILAITISILDATQAHWVLLRIIFL